MNNNDDKIKANNDISSREVFALRVAGLSFLAIPIFSFATGLFVDPEGYSPKWVNFLPFFGSALALLICLLVVLIQTRVNEATNRMKAILKLSVASTIAMGLIFLIFGNNLEDESALGAGICILAFAQFVPVIGLILAFSPLPKSMAQSGQ